MPFRKAGLLKHSSALCLALLIFIAPASAESFKSNKLDPSYHHDWWGTSNKGILKHFTAYTSSFDDADDDNGDGMPDALGVPEWVAYEIKRFDGPCIKTAARPANWITDDALKAKGLMPTDDSYDYPAAFRKTHKDWYDRGHLAMKLHAERISSDAAWNTHTFYNAVPQRHTFNAGIWLDLEDLTAAWAQEYGEVWVIDGPIFKNHSPSSYIGEKGEFPVAVPDALFKIVVKEGAKENVPDVLAFIYPQQASDYLKKSYDHARYLTTVDEIEEQTGLDFLMVLPDSQEKNIEKIQAKKLWNVQDVSYIRACSNKGNRSSYK